jgi:hypothetical protein
MRESNVVEGSGINVARGPRVQAMKLRYDIRRMDVLMYHPGVIADIIALPLDQVLQAVPVHAHVQYGLYLVFLFAFHKDWWGRGFRVLADDRVRSSQSELNDRENWVQSGETWWKFQTVCAVANTSFDCIWAQMTVGKFYRWLVGSDVHSVNPHQVTWL